MNYIDLCEIIAEAQQENGERDDVNTPIMKVWAYDAQRQIGFGHLSIVNSDWIPVNSRLEIKKPCDLFVPLKIEISIDKKNCVIPFLDRDFVKCDSCENSRSDCSIKIGENQKTFYLPSDASDYRFARIKYLKYPIGEDGEPQISEICAPAIKQYLSFMLTRLKRKLNRADVPQSEVSEERNNWTKMRREAMGRQKMPRTIDMNGISQKWLNTGPTPSNHSLTLHWNYFTGRY